MAGWTLVRAGEAIHYEVRAEPGQLLMLPDQAAADLITTGRAQAEGCPLTIDLPEQRATETAAPHITVNLPSDMVNLVNVVETPDRRVTIHRDADGKIAGADVTDG